MSGLTTSSRMVAARVLIGTLAPVGGQGRLGAATLEQLTAGDNHLH